MFERKMMQNPKVKGGNQKKGKENHQKIPKNKK
jgi:hypothetical protein